MNVSVLGCGRWGTFLAWYSNKIGHNVMLWGRESSSKFTFLKENRKNEYLEISEDIKLTNSLLLNSLKISIHISVLSNSKILSIDFSKFFNI